MRHDEFSGMRAFLEVARERSFTRAAARLGVTRSALSHTIRDLEETLGVRLLSRTTRDVAPTAAGQRLMEDIAPHFDGIAAGVEAITALRGVRAGHVRLVCPDDAVNIVFRPRLPAFLKANPGISVELLAENGLTNIVERQLDAGVRLGEAIARDMISVRIGPDVRYAVIGSPGYFAQHAAPQTPQELTSHTCINLRMVTSGALYAWEFQHGAREFSVKVEGQMTTNTMGAALDFALDGAGLAYVPKDLAQPHLETGRLTSILEEWCPAFQGYHLYYPSRRNPSPAFAAFVDAFRYRAP